MKFKFGDKIRAKKGTPAYTNYKDEILTVDNPCDAGYFTLGELDSNHICYLEPNGYHNGWNINFFELAIPKKKPITEVDFLDCFQMNFKEEY